MDNYKIYSKQIEKHYKPINKVEQVELFELYREKGSTKAYNAIYYSALKLVIKVSRNFLNKGVEFEDLIQAGNMGLDRAIKGFDVSKDVKFISYAVNWISQGMRKLVAEQGRPIKVITRDVQNYSNMKKAINRLEQKLHRKPTPEEISEESGFKLEDLDLMVRMETQQSMDAGINGNEYSLHNTLQDKSALSPEDYVLSNISDKLEKFVEKANLKGPSRANVVKQYYGIGKNVPTCMQEIADRIGCKRQNVEMLRKTSLESLRGFNEAEKIKGNYHLSFETTPLSD